MNRNKEEVKLCPACKRPMLLKRGKYGMFWGCSMYPKCKVSMDATGEKIKLLELEVINIDYLNVIKNGDIKKLINECAEKDAKLNDMLKKSSNINECMEDNNICSRILGYLHKLKRYLDLSKFVYGIYLVRGILTSNYKYWINNLEHNKNYIEKDVKKVILNNWNKSIFNVMDLKMIGEEIFIGDIKEGGGVIDILAREAKTDTYVLIEIKGPNRNGRVAWGQLKAYIETYKKFHNNNVKGIIVSRGYPFGIYEESFGLISYIIEDNKIAFIPWKI